mgnify:CR=1 FL=1
MSYVVRDADGSYWDAEGNPQDAHTTPRQQQQQERQREMKKEQSTQKDFLSPATRYLVNEVRQQLGTDSADTVITRALVGSIVDNANPEPAVNEMASALGIEPAHAAKFLDQIAEAALTNAAEYISQKYPGVDGQEVFEWATDNMRANSKASIMSSILNGSTADIDKMVEKFRIKERF